jgi:tRNA A37 threonylcarbamoyltransferase TsaD
MDEAYNRLKKAYDALTNEQQKQVTLPTKQTCHDNGMMGLKSGFASGFRD